MNWADEIFILAIEKMMTPDLHIIGADENLILQDENTVCENNIQADEIIIFADENIMKEWNENIILVNENIM